MDNNNRKNRTLFVGEVVSDKMQKTIMVKVDRTFIHPKVHKVVRVSKKYAVHDENELAQLGDKVSFYEGRPVSKTKCMYLDQILEKDANS